MLSVNWVICVVQARVIVEIAIVNLFQGHTMPVLKRASLFGKITEGGTKQTRPEVPRGPLIACVRHWGSAFAAFEGGIVVLK